MKITIPEATIGTAGAQQVSVGEVRLGAVHVGLLSLNGVTLQASSGVAQLRNVQVVLTLVFALDWTVGVVIDAGVLGKIDFSQSGTLNLGTLQLGIGFGHVSLPGLADLSLDIPTLALADVPAAIGALKKLELGPLLAERIKARGLVAPTAGFQLDGLGLGAASAQDLALPAAALDGVTIRRISGGTLPLAGLSVPDVSFPQVRIPRLSCQDIAADSQSVVTEMPEADVGLLKGTLRVTTTAHLEVEELRVDGLQAAASIGEIALRDVVLPYEILDLTLAKIGIEHIGVPAVKVS